MTMITCEECGYEFSDKADACPKCGCPLYDEPDNSDEVVTASEYHSPVHRAVRFLFLLSFLLIVGGCFGEHVGMSGGQCLAVIMWGVALCTFFFIALIFIKVLK